MKAFIRDFPDRLKTAPALVEYRPSIADDRNKMKQSEAVPPKSK
jgi:hypothetical protein